MTKMSIVMRKTEHNADVLSQKQLKPLTDRPWRNSSRQLKFTNMATGHAGFFVLAEFSLSDPGTLQHHCYLDRAIRIYQTCPTIPILT